MSMTVRSALLGLALGSALAAATAEARDAETCMQLWGKAVRSYLTQNRTQGPDDEVFRPACEIEGSDKDKARIEAVLIGTRALAKLDPRGCAKFLDIYVEAKGSKQICDRAATSPDDADGLRKLIAESVPPRKKK